MMRIQTQAISLQRLERTLAKRRHQKAEYFAQLLFMHDIPSSALDPKNEMEWIELQRAAETHGKPYGVPSLQTRLMILCLLRERECRRGQTKGGIAA